MPLNNPSAGSSGRTPVATVTVDTGTGPVALADWRSIEVEESAHYTADTFRVAVPLYSLPAAMNAAWWSTQTDVELAVAAGIAGPDGTAANLSQLIVGPIDTVETAMIGSDKRATLTLAGRNYVGAFLDSIVTEQLTRFERVIEASLPGDPLLTENTLVQLTGTGTDFDQFYYVDSLSHTIDVDGGWTMELRAKNHSTYSTLPL